jgi:lipoyl(octanoyl) transferase
MTLCVRDLGLLEYAAAHAEQERTLAARIAETSPDTLLLVEHPAVITMGRGTHADNLLDPAELPVVRVERGGDVTLHAPGQLVGYLIRKLPNGARELRPHLQLIEETLAAVALRFGLHAGRKPRATGLWIEDRKLASIGIACRRHVTWHGFALNVHTDLDLFRRINPCGFSANVMTSLARELPNAPSMAEVKQVVAAAFEQRLAVARP